MNGGHTQYVLAFLIAGLVCLVGAPPSPAAGAAPEDSPAVRSPEDEPGPTPGAGVGESPGEGESPAPDPDAAEPDARGNADREGNGDEADDGLCDLLDDLGVLYESDDNRFVQRLRLKGGFDLHWATGWSDQGRYSTRDLPSDERFGPIELRRFRLGAEVEFLEEFTLDLQFNLGARPQDIYGDIYQFWVEWRRLDAFRPAVGILRIPFTQEYTIPDSRIVTIERSLLVEQMLPTSLTGVMVTGDVGPFSYNLGAFAADDRDEFSRFDEGYAFLVKLGYDLAEHIDAFDKFDLGVDYLASTDAENTGVAPYRHAWALYTDVERDGFNVLTEAIYGRGFGEVPDVYGVNVIPSLFVYRETIQLVGRYSFAVSDGELGLQLRDRYERLAPDLQVDGVGRRYHAVYGGVNWYLCHPDVRLMAGLEYHHLDGGNLGDDFSGVTFAAAFRFWF